MAPITDTKTRTEIAARHTARYGRAVQMCARHAMSDDYTERHAKALDTFAREAAHKAADNGSYAPIIDRLERALGMDSDA